MRRQFTFQQYRSIDLFMFAGMLILSEFLLVTAATRWYPDQLYTVSVTAALTAIVMVRWRAWGAIHAVLGGAVYCWVSHGTPMQFLIYCAGNLAALAALGILRIWGDEKIRSSAFNAVVYGLCVQLLMQLGRAAVALLLGTQPARCVGFITTDVLSGLFTAVILWIVRRLDGILEDQKHYLLRVNREEEKGGF